MSFSVGDIIKDVYQHWNRPAESDLPQSDVVTIINRKINRLLLLSQLTTRNYLAVLSTPFTFNGSEMTKSLNLDGLSAVVRVESRSIGSDDLNWSEEVISDYGAWNDVMDRTTDSVAFYGHAVDGLTMAVNRDASSLEFRILYETGGVSLANFNDAVPVVQDFFRSTIFYGAAAEAGMQMGNLSNVDDERKRDKKVAYLAAQEDQSIREFKQWLLNEPGQAVSYREAFNSTRMGLGRARMHASDVDGGYYSPY
jgi:hypothetical protein